MEFGWNPSMWACTHPSGPGEEKPRHYRDRLGTDLPVFFGSNVAHNQPVATKYTCRPKERGTRGDVAFHHGALRHLVALGGVDRVQAIVNLAPVGDVEAPGRRGLSAVETVHPAHEDAVDVLWAIGGDYLGTLPDPDHCREALLLRSTVGEFQGRGRVAPVEERNLRVFRPEADPLILRDVVEPQCPMPDFTAVVEVVPHPGAAEPAH